MPSRETADTIDEAASDWAARIDRGLSDSERDALETWLGADSRRVGALARARALWIQAREAMGEVAPSQPEPDLPDAGPVAAPVSRATRRALILGGAGTALAASIAAVVTLRGQGTALESGIGEVRRIALEDGSAITLGPGTRVVHYFDLGRRRVEILAGQAFFDVVQDPRRPITVLAKWLTVEALGGAFAVSALDALPLSVVVAHGQVRVEAQGRRRVLGSNMRIDLPAAAAMPATAAARIEPEALQRALAWREGMLAFEGQPLGEVAAQFDRFGPVRIEITDPALAREPITGLFAANDPRGFAQAIAASLDARVEMTGDRVRLLRSSSAK